MLRIACAFNKIINDSWLERNWGWVTILAAYVSCQYCLNFDMNKWFSIIFDANWGYFRSISCLRTHPTASWRLVKRGRLFLLGFPHLPLNVIIFSFIYKAGFQGQSNEICSIKKVNIVKPESCEGKSNTNTTSSYGKQTCQR